MVPDGTRVAYHQFGYLHPEVEVQVFDTVPDGSRRFPMVPDNMEEYRVKNLDFDFGVKVPELMVSDSGTVGNRLYILLMWVRSSRQHE